MKPDPRVRVLVTMRSLVFLTLVACGGTKPKQEPMSGSGSAEPVVVDARPELVKRRDGACEKLRPRLVQCAVDDTKAEFDAEAGNVLLGRRATPDAVAQALRYLIEAELVTGQMIAVDGGQHLAWRTPDIAGD